jgi:hypothetical protein
MTKILTFNTCWSYTDKKRNPDYYKIARKKLEEFVEKRFYDIGFFQEANYLEKRKGKLFSKKYNTFTHSSGKDVVMTVYRRDLFDRDQRIGYKVGEFEVGRPWSMIFFERDKVCLMNIHMGHYRREEWRRKFREFMREMPRGWRYILGGDCNMSITHRMFEDRSKKRDKRLYRMFHMYGKYIKTCCAPMFMFDKKRPKDTHASDHIMDTRGPIMGMKTIRVSKYISDHKPLYAKVLPILRKNVLGKKSSKKIM